MAIAVKEEVQIITEPKVRDPATMTEEELTDPDFRLKQLAKEAGLSKEEILTCSRCHHCRR